MKNIGYVLADFPVFSETFVGNEMRAMARYGHRVTPFVMNRRRGPAHAEDIAIADAAPDLGAVSAGAAALALARPSATAPAAMAFVRQQTRLRPRSLFWNAMKIASLARRHHCQHLHAHFSGGAAAHAIVAARWIGCSVSFVCHGHDVYAEAEDLPLKLRSADAVVAVCHDMANDLLALAPGARVDTIACGTDPETLLPNAEGPSYPRLLFIGRLVEQKGLDDLLDALTLHPTASIDIVGSGPLRDAYVAQANVLGLAGRVRFLGDRGRDWIKSEASRYLALVAPFKPASDGARDSGPIVVKEAMAMAMPVIATRFMGNKEMVSDETGILTNVGDPRDLAAAISRLLALPAAARAAMGRRAREIVIDRYSLGRQAQNLSALIEAL